jgi:cell division protein FtsB
MRSFVMLGLLAVSAVFADTIEVQAPVKAATLYYPELAILTREIRFQAETGDHDLLIPFHGDSYSLPFVDFSSPDVELLATTLMTDRLPVLSGQTTEAIDAAKARITELETQIRDQQAEADRLRLRQRAAEEEIAILKSLPSAGFVEGEPLAAQAEALASITAERITKALADGFQAGVDADAIDRARELLEADHALAQQALAGLEVAPTEDIENSVIVARVRVTNAGEHVITMTDAAMAGWRTTYDVRMTRTGSEAKIDFETAVLAMQNSGEDWTGIALTISTAAPSGGEQIWQSGGERWSLVSDEELARRDEERKAAETAYFADVTVVEDKPMSVALGLNFNYTFPTPVTIRSTEEDVLRLSLRDDVLTAKLVAVVDPDEDTANLKAEVINTTGAPILPGEMRLWLDGALVGLADEYAMDGEVIPEGGKLDLWFGPIWGLTAEYDAKGDVTGRDGVFVSSNRRETEKSLVIRNLTKETWPVRAFMGFDYSSNEDLVIETTATPEMTEKDADTTEGLAAWNFDLAPSETKTIAVKQVLTWPSGYQIE